MATVIIITPIFSILVELFGFSSLILTIVIVGIFEFIIFRKLATKQNEILVLSVLKEETDCLRKKLKHTVISNYELKNT